MLCARNTRSQVVLSKKPVVGLGDSDTSHLANVGNNITAMRGVDMRQAI